MFGKQKQYLWKKLLFHCGVRTVIFKMKTFGGKKRDVKVMTVCSYTVYRFSMLSFLLKFHLKRNGRNLLFKKFYLFSVS